MTASGAARVEHNLAVCVGCSQAFESLRKRVKPDGARAHVSDVKFIPRHKARDHVEVSFVVCHDESDNKAVYMLSKHQWFNTSSNC